MKNNISIIQKVKKQKTINHNYLPNDINKKVDLIFERYQINDNWDENKEYYEKFLWELKAERKKSHALLKTNLKVDRKKLSKTLKLNDVEKKKVKSTISTNNNKKKSSLLHSFFKKTLIQKKKKENNNFFENIKKEDLEVIIEKPNLQMTNNIQLFFQSPKKRKNSLDLKKEENKTMKNNMINHKIIDSTKIYSTLINKGNPFETDFDIENNYRISTFCNLELNEKKREEITKTLFNKVEKNFISNATKIEFNKNSDIKISNNTYDNNIENKKSDKSDKNENNVFIYTIKDDSGEKKKLKFCCCIPMK